MFYLAKSIIQIHWKESTNSRGKKHSCRELWYKIIALELTILLLFISLKAIGSYLQTDSSSNSNKTMLLNNSKMQELEDPSKKSIFSSQGIIV